MKEINGNFETTFIFSTHDARVMAMADRGLSNEDGQLTEGKENSTREKHEITHPAPRRENWVIQGGGLR